MQEEPLRVGGRLEATLRLPDDEPIAAAVVCHPLPTHGGTMRNPLIATIARSLAERGVAALRFNFRGTGESAGEFTGGREEERDLETAVAVARERVPGRSLLVAGFSFGALMTLKWKAMGGRADAVVLLGLPLRSLSLAPEAMPPLPRGTIVIQGEHDQFGTADEVRSAHPGAVIHAIAGVDHFFVERAAPDASATGPTGALRTRYREVGALVADLLLREARLA